MVLSALSRRPGRLPRISGEGGSDLLASPPVLPSLPRGLVAWMENRSDVCTASEFLPRPVHPARRPLPSPLVSLLTVLLSSVRPRPAILTWVRGPRSALSWAFELCCLSSACLLFPRLRTSSGDTVLLKLCVSHDTGTLSFLRLLWPHSRWGGLAHS